MRSSWRADRAADEAGSTTVVTVVAVAFSLLLVTLLADLAVVQYGRAAARAAVDEAARAGARVVDDPARALRSCHEAAEAARATLLGGALGAGLVISCGSDGAWSTAAIDGAFPGWLPGTPDHVVAVRARARQESAP